jgi:hypothetical protein
MTRRLTLLIAIVSLVAIAIPAAAPGRPTKRRKQQNTRLISRAWNGGMPNGESSHAVISGDRRWARAIAFESDASNLIRHDTNRFRDVFVVKRTGHFVNNGSKWKIGRTIRVSRPRRGGQANGPSWGASIGGAFYKRPKCVAFLSAASNLVPHDTNGKVDAFVVNLSGRKIRRISLPAQHQSQNDTTQVAVSGNCSRYSFVNNGFTFTRRKGHTKKIAYGMDPSYSAGKRNDLVFAGPHGVYLSIGGWQHPRMIAGGGFNPAYNDVKRRVVSYEKRRGGHTQVYFKDLGKREHVASKRRGRVGNGDSRNPVIGNSGYYISFESDATNLGVNSLSRIGDFNGMPDSYLYTNVRDITLVQSVFEKAVPLNGGGMNPSMSFYANYILFDSPAPMGSNAPHQIYMRYLGPV